MDADNLLGYEIVFDRFKETAEKILKHVFRSRTPTR